MDPFEEMELKCIHLEAECMIHACASTFRSVCELVCTYMCMCMCVCRHDSPEGVALNSSGRVDSSSSLFLTMITAWYLIPGTTSRMMLLLDPG